MTAGRQVISDRKDWLTPPKYAKVVQGFLGVIALDPCAHPHGYVDAKTRYQLPAHDGLEESWDFPTIFVNPPYGYDQARSTSIADWLWQCAAAHEHHGAEVLALVPVATNTRHWQENVFETARSVCFCDVPRFPFWRKGGPVGTGAPMACAFVYWGRKPRRFQRHFAACGAVTHLRVKA